jgi:hypothetical protein
MPKPWKIAKIIRDKQLGLIRMQKIMNCIIHRKFPVGKKRGKIGSWLDRGQGNGKE